jgi:hypothetical protein
MGNPKAKNRWRILVLLLILGVVLVWAGPGSICARYIHWFVFQVGSNDAIDWKARHLFIVGASTRWYRPLLQRTGDTAEHAGRVTYYFWYHGYPRMEGARSAGVVVDTTKNTIIEVRTESWL